MRLVVAASRGQHTRGGASTERHVRRLFHREPMTRQVARFALFTVATIMNSDRILLSQCPTWTHSAGSWWHGGMSGVAYIARCRRCGVARKTYNDPRRGISVIECKRPCGDSHYDWAFVQTIAADEAWPPADITTTAIPVYVRPTQPPPSLAASRQASPSPTNPGHATPSATKDSKIRYKSKGRDSVARSSSPAARARRASSVSPGAPPSAPAPSPALHVTTNTKVPSLSSSKSGRTHKRKKSIVDCAAQ